MNDIRRLNEASRTAIKETILELRLQLRHGESSDSTLTAIITGSKAMKKVILDGLYPLVEDEVEPQLLEPLKVVKEACKKKDVELWKKDFDDGNGKVDLEK